MREELVATWVSDNGIPRITVEGEVNISTRPLLDKVLCEARTQEPFSLIVSLEKCTYCDSAGLAVLMRHGRQVPHFIVISPEDTAVRRLLRITRLDQVFDVVQNGEIARARCAVPSTSPRRSQFGDAENDRRAQA